MAKLVFEREFSLEVGDKVYAGTLTDLTKKQKQDLEKKSKNDKTKVEELQKVLKQINKQKRKIEIAEKQEKWSEIEALENGLESLESSLEALNQEFDKNSKNLTENIFKDRIEMSVNSSNKADIIALCEEYGYQTVFETIIKDVQEKQKGN